MTYYHLTYGIGGRIVSRWLVSYEIDANGTLTGIDVRGFERVVGSSMPYSLAEREELPPDVSDELPEPNDDRYCNGVEVNTGP